MHGVRGAGAPSGAGPRPAFVVEDDPMMLSLLSEVAASVGLRPVPFTRLAAARRALRERTPVVLVIDDNLPDGRGGDLAREVRDDPRLRDVRVIVCTGAGHARRRQLAGDAPVIAKPFAVEEMERALRRVTAG